MKTISLAVIPGDGIGKEVLPAALRVLDVAAELHGGLKVKRTEFPWSCESYVAHAKMCPDDWRTTDPPHSPTPIRALAVHGSPGARANFQQTRAYCVRWQELRWIQQANNHRGAH